jgi:L-asparaginase
MLTIEELVDEIRSVPWYPDPQDFASLAFTELLSIGSERFTPDEWIAIAGEVRDAVAEAGVDGVVITHGTFTAEETAYFLHLTVNTRKPIVLACSQRAHGTIGNDGDRNLVDAIRFAAEPAASGMGVALVVNEAVHSARGVVKTNGRPDGFASPNGGMLGHVYSDRIAIYKEPHRRHTHLSEFSRSSNIPRVDIVATYAGSDGTAVEALVQHGVAGLVVNGFSFNGMPHHMQADALHVAIAEGIPVVVVNRGGGGRIAPDRYNEGFILGDDLSAQQARVLLGVALSHGVELGDLQRVFDEY